MIDIFLHEGEHGQMIYRHRGDTLVGADLTGANFTGTFPRNCKFSGGKLLNIIVKDFNWRI